MIIFNSYLGAPTELAKKDIYDIYVCGVTPYDTAHVGHAATFTYFDTLIHHIEHNLGSEVNYVQNITDIDDSIIARAKETNQDIFELAKSQTSKLAVSMQRLGLRKPNKMPTVSGKMTEIIESAHVLQKNDFLYELDDNWYFDYSKTVDRLPSLPVDNATLMKIFDSRGGNSKLAGKRNPLDFIVWQKSLEGEPSYDSPLGKGRPGWHIECTAMLLDEFGKEIDIHGGGEDLKFPHHTSEIAQNIGLGNQSVAKIWMHTGSVNFFGEKMSKSLGNMIYVDELIGKYPSGAIKIAILTNHYINGFSWSKKLIDESNEFYKKIEQAHAAQVGKKTLTDAVSKARIIQYLNDDLDTPGALRFLEDSCDDAIIMHDQSEVSNIFAMCEALKIEII